MSGRLDGKVALVVGGGSGMGRAGAVAMAARGRARRGRRHRPRARRGRGRELRRRSRSPSTSATPAASSAWWPTTVERFGRLDVVYHCAVDVPFVNTQDRRLTELDEDVWTRMIDLVLTGDVPRRQVRRPPDARRRARARSSSRARSTRSSAAPGLDSYTAAKGGVTALTRSLAAGLAPDGIRVNAIAPSFVSTEPQKVWLEDDASRTTIEQLHLLEIPTPEEIAPLVVYLASDESRRMTGTVIPLDSGYMAFKAQPRRDGRDAGEQLARPRRGRRRARAARRARCAGRASRAA